MTETKPSKTVTSPSETHTFADQDQDPTKRAQDRTLIPGLKTNNTGEELAFLTQVYTKGSCTGCTCACNSTLKINTTKQRLFQKVLFTLIYALCCFLRSCFSSSSLDMTSVISCCSWLLRLKIKESKNNQWISLKIDYYQETYIVLSQKNEVRGLDCFKRQTNKETN